MSKLYFLCFWAFVLYPISSFAQSDSAFEKEPTWEEHFNGKGYPRTSNWTLSQTYTKEHLAHYVENPHNVYVKRGKLHLVLRKDAVGSYTSGRIISKRTFSCGKLEFRAQCPINNGVWSAIWLRDASKEKCRGEIDVVEQIGCWGKSKYQLNFHLWGGVRSEGQ